MCADKAEFKRLIESMGWSQTEAARRLRKRPSAINHLVNPDHPNKPTATTMELLRPIIARERPGLVNTQTGGLKEARPKATRLSAKERECIEDLRQLPPGDQKKAYAARVGAASTRRRRLTAIIIRQTHAVGSLSSVILPSRTNARSQRRTQNSP
jgi:transcriptional regulator with XRE-family HTH domain